MILTALAYWLALSAIGVTILVLMMNRDRRERERFELELALAPYRCIEGECHRNGG